MDTFALRSPGRVHFVRSMEIMRDMRPLISSLLLVIISLVMAVAGRVTRLVIPLISVGTLPNIFILCFVPLYKN